MELSETSLSISGAYLYFMNIIGNYILDNTAVQDKSEWAFFGQVSDCFYTMPSGRLKARLHWPKMLSKSWMVRKIGPFIAQHIPKSWDSGDSKRTWRFGHGL